MFLLLLIFYTIHNTQSQQSIGGDHTCYLFFSDFRPGFSGL